MVRMAGGSSGIAHRWGPISQVVTMSDCTWKITRWAAVRHAVTGQRLARRSLRSMEFGLHGHTTAWPWSLESTIPRDQEMTLDRTGC